MGEKLGGRQCVVIGGGDIMDYGRAAAEMEAGAFILCVDGGYRHCKGLGVAPDLLVGDFDSIGRKLPDNIPAVRLPPDKDYTDTTLALEQARERGFAKFLLTGMLGGRLDHTLANIQELCHCVRRGEEAYITDGKTRVYALSARGAPTELTLRPQPGHYFSLLAVSERCEGVTIYGGAYPLQDYPLRHDKPRAVSNEFTDEPVRILIRDGTLLVITTPVK